MDPLQIVALVEINKSIALTPKHPIWSQNEWKKPY